MRIVLILISALMLFGEVRVFASDAQTMTSSVWTRGDTAREVVWQVINAVDWGTSLDGASQPNKYGEANPILGTHPSSQAVNVYFGSMAVLHFAVSWLLPDAYRVPWQYITIGVTGAAATNNLSIGLQVRY